MLSVQLYWQLVSPCIQPKVTLPDLVRSLCVHRWHIKASALWGLLSPVSIGMSTHLCGYIPKFNLVLCESNRSAAELKKPDRWEFSKEHRRVRSEVSELVTR